jgi:hypothetical protein
MAGAFFCATLNFTLQTVVFTVDKSTDLNTRTYITIVNASSTRLHSVTA